MILQLMNFEKPRKSLAPQLACTRPQPPRTHGPWHSDALHKAGVSILRGGTAGTCLLMVDTTYTVCRPWRGACGTIRCMGQEQHHGHSHISCSQLRAHDIIITHREPGPGALEDDRRRRAVAGALANGCTTNVLGLRAHQIAPVPMKTAKRTAVRSSILQSAAHRHGGAPSGLHEAISNLSMRMCVKDSFCRAPRSL